MSLFDIATTSPETDETTFADIPSCAWAIIVPIFTLSPIATTGSAGLPICMDKGKMSVLGTLASEIVRSSVLSLRSSWNIPPFFRIKLK